MKSVYLEYPNESFIESSDRTWSRTRTGGMAHAPVAVLVEVDGEPVYQATFAFCYYCRGPCRAPPGEHPFSVAYARPAKNAAKKNGGEQ